jgi:hypothetical protein
LNDYRNNDPHDLAPLVGGRVTACVAAFGPPPACVPAGEPALSDADGIAEVSLPFGADGFSGYFLVEGAGEAGETPLLYKLGRPILSHANAYVPMLSDEDALALLAQYIPEPQASFEHTIYFFAHDCLTFGAKDVTVEVEGVPEAEVGYVGHGDATSSESADAAGKGWIVGLEPNRQYVLVMRYDGEEIGRERIATLAGTVTYAHLFPSPVP